MNLLKELDKLVQQQLQDSLIYHSTAQTQLKISR